MNLYYTKHIQKRILQRELTLEIIEKTLSKPDSIQPTFKGRYLAQKDFHGKILEVVYKEEDNRIVLITAYWLEEEP